jgi:hypothetical protein
VFAAAIRFYTPDPKEHQQRSQWLVNATNNPNIAGYGIKMDLWLVAGLAEAVQLAIRDDDATCIQELRDYGWLQACNYNKRDAATLEGIIKRTRQAAAVLTWISDTNKKVAETHQLLPTDRSELIKYGQISIVSLAGYTGDFQATIYSIVADDLFAKKVNKVIRWPFLFFLEEAHNFAPAQAQTEAERRAVVTSRQIAQEGRKFSVGLVLISQRPSRLDETTLSQCNSQIIMRMVNPADQNFVRRVVESLGDEDIRMLSGLDIGEAILAGQMINFPVLVRIKPPESKGEREEEDAFESLEKVYRELQSRGSS